MTGFRAYFCEAAMLYSILNEDPEPLAGEGKDIPAGLDGIIAKALAKDPARRYQKAEDLVADLQALVQDSAALPAGKARSAKGLRRVWRSWGPWQRAACVAALAVIMAGMVWGGVKFWPGRTELLDSIGVIPLKNLSGDPSKDAFVEGVTEQLTACMGAISSISIKSPQSMKQFKDSNDPLRRIGRRANVKALLEGSLALVGDRVKITILLSEASTDRQIWSHNYDGVESDIIVFQSQIVRTVAEKLKAQMTPQSEAQLAAAKPVNSEAYEAYLKGVRFNNSWDRDKALEQFRLAIGIDREFAPAYGGMAIAYTNLALGYDMNPTEAAPLARAQAELAVQLDDKSADAHDARAYVRFSFDWDWSGAESDYKRALELTPNNGYIQLKYGYFLLCAGRTKEGLAYITPANKNGWGDLFWTYFYTRHYDDAIALLTKDAQKGSKPPVDEFLMYSYVLKGMRNEAMAQCKALEAAPNFRNNQWLMSFVGWGYGAMKEREKALEILNRLRELGKKEYVDPYVIAMVCAGMGDNDQAFTSLREDIEIRQPAAVQMAIEPAFDNMHSDPRWQELLDLIHYPKSKP